MKHTLLNIAAVGLLALTAASCEKILNIKPPIASITTEKAFQNDEQVALAINGMYSNLIHGSSGTSPEVALVNFCSGGVTVLNGYSADEFYRPDLNGSFPFYYVATNQLSLLTAGNVSALWTSAYKAIYTANAIIEGISASKSPELSESGKNQMNAQALVVRAMSYFYLVNQYGQVPLVLTIDFNKSQVLPSSGAAAIYGQIIADLEAAIPLLSESYTGLNAERIMVSRWYAKALLARVFLYTKNYPKAAQYANELITQPSLFKLEPLNAVFKVNSKEVIFQLKQDNSSSNIRNATPEAVELTGTYLAPGLLNAFEVGDNRKLEWTAPIIATPNLPAGVSPSKYKVDRTNYVQNGARSEYYVVMRLAELYLIHAEASLLSNAGNKKVAIDDLNAIRNRAGLDSLPYTISVPEVEQAIAKERQIELFAEWGHRWMDLKRTNKAIEVLEQITYKQPFQSFQLLYPIPPNEILWANNLSQNSGYID